MNFIGDMRRWQATSADILFNYKTRWNLKYMFTVSSINKRGLFYLISDTLYILIWPLLSCFVLIVILFSCRGPRDTHAAACNFTYHCTHRPSRHSLRLGGAMLLLLDSVQLSAAVVRSLSGFHRSDPSQDIPSSIFLFGEILGFELPGAVRGARRNCFISRPLLSNLTNGSSSKHYRPGVILTTFYRSSFFSSLNPNQYPATTLVSTEDRYSPKGKHRIFTRIAKSNSF